MIYVTGDMHGVQNRLIYSKEEKLWTEQDVVIVCGDFGFLFRNNDVENCFLDDLSHRPYTLCFVDGNHENFPAIYAYPEETWCGGRIHRIRKNVLHLMRGQVFEIQGKKIFTFGGAYSRDRSRRELGVSYWEEEIPTPSDYREADRNLQAHGCRVDLVLTHQAPQSIIRRIGESPDPHDAKLTGYLDYLYQKNAQGKRPLEFGHWYCGHWHRNVEPAPDFSILYEKIASISGRSTKFYGP